MSNVLLNSLYKYYDDKNVKILLEVLEEDTNVSLRIIDWFVTNYSKKNMYNKCHEKIQYYEKSGSFQRSNIQD